MDNEISFRMRDPRQPSSAPLVLFLVLAGSSILYSLLAGYATGRTAQPPPAGAPAPIPPIVGTCTPGIAGAEALEQFCVMWQQRAVDAERELEAQRNRPAPNDASTALALERATALEARMAEVMTQSDAYRRMLQDSQGELASSQASLRAANTQADLLRAERDGLRAQLAQPHILLTDALEIGVIVFLLAVACGAVAKRVADSAHQRAMAELREQLDAARAELEHERKTRQRISAMYREVISEHERQAKRREAEAATTSVQPKEAKEMAHRYA